MTHTIPLAEAIAQLRNDLRSAVLDAEGQKIVFIPKEIELELGITFGTELKAGGGFKLLAFLDLSTEAKASDTHQHKIKLKLEVQDDKGNTIKLRPSGIPGGV